MFMSPKIKDDATVINDAIGNESINVKTVGS